MKKVVTHSSRNTEDLINILKVSGSFCCPRLPHYRYAQTQRATAQLIKSGMIVPCGKTDVGTNYKKSELFKVWMAELEKGETNLQPIKWAKNRKRVSQNDPE